MKKSLLITLLAFLPLIAIMVSSQCRYCNTYEDFLEGHWEQVDTVYFSSHSKKHQVWVGGNDFTLKAGDKAIDKILKKKAFAVMQGDELYVNCCNLRFEKTSFGKGYTKAIRMGENDLLLVNKMIGRDAQLNAAMTGFFFGAIGAALVAGDLAKQQVCYVISNGANKKGRITIQLIDDEYMHPIVQDDDQLHFEYWSEADRSKRIHASHVLPILEKAGLIELTPTQRFYEPRKK